MDIIAILNTIRANASANYQARIPEANRTNMEDVRFAMLDDDNVQIANEFMSTLLNKIVKSVLHTKRFTNPLKPLKKGSKPNGDTIEEIYNNFMKCEQYNPNSGADLMKRTLPDTKTVYHRMNYQVTYPVTVSREALSRAFKSPESLEKYITDIINALYNSAELDEFANMKQILKSAYDKGAMKKVTVPDPITGEAAAREFIKSVKTTSGMMAFPSTEWNGYTTAQETDTEPIWTFSRKGEQVLILDTATDVSVAVDVLAASFNMTVAEFNDTRKIVIDQFPAANVRAMLIDEAFFQVYDDLFLFKSWENPKSLYNNYYLHVWQTLAFSILVNAVAFEVDPAAA